MPRPLIHVAWFALLLGGYTRAQDLTLTARVTLERKDPKTNHALKAENVVLWLTPDVASGQAEPASAQPHPRLVQLNKSFQPHVVVVPVGSVVEFPNHDPFFHNVFSLHEGKRFDLGLYEAGTTRDVRFDRPGVSYIFCNIHPQMSAVVLALNTAFYGISDRRGEVIIPNVPAGRYTLHFWYEAALPETLRALSRELTVSENSSTLGVLHLVADDVPQAHKNKYGRDYDTPTPQNPAYDQP
jgi:plastocyanin